ncbi:MAG: hypothetical protein H7318_17155 [Oligoflexus sp.]|nr:hypothetical protein [Oligoflexus sp.]
MKSGLEEFLKRIEAKPTNETLIDRFMTLVLEEDGVERILYLKSLVGLLLKSNPYAALKAAYVELQEARKEKLSNEYEIGALKDVESCFINLGKTENAALVREEIIKLQSDSPAIQAIVKPSAPKPSQKPSHDSFEFPGLPEGDDGLNPVGMNAERTRAKSPAQGHTSIDLSRTSDVPSKKPFENKPIPTFPSDTKSSSPSPSSAPRQVPASAPVQAQAPSIAPGRTTVPPQESAQDQFRSDMFMPKGEALHPVHDQTRASPINMPSKPSTTSIPLESSFHADELVEPLPPLVEADEADDFGFNFEYTKRTGISGLSEEIGSMGNIGANVTLNRAEPLPSGKRPAQAGFSLKDDIGDDYISAGSEIDEKFENQPFFQPDDDDEEELPPADRTMLISLEKLNESKEQINLAATSSASVKDVNYPINSGPNFVVLDADDEDTATDLPPAALLPGVFDSLTDASAPTSHPFMSTAFDPDNALLESAYSRLGTVPPTASPFVYEEEVSPPVAVEMMPDLLAPTPLSSSSVGAAHPAPVSEMAPSAAPSPRTTVPPQATMPFNLEPDFMGMAPFQTATPAAAPVAEVIVKVEVQPKPMPSPISFTSPPMAAMEETVATGQKPLMAAQSASTPFVRQEEPDAPLSYSAASESFQITPHPILESKAGKSPVVDDADDEIDYRYKEDSVATKSSPDLEDEYEEEGEVDANANASAKPLRLVPQVTSIQKWTLVQERLKLLSGLQIGRSHAVDFVKRLLSVKNENPVVIKTLNLLLQFVEAKLDKALCGRMATWLFEELHPRAMHQLWESLNLKEEGLEFYLVHVKDLIKVHQHRRALSIMHDILCFDLDLAWYVESYPFLIRTWDKLGLEGWIWLEEEGGTVFCDRLARREDPLLATLLI